MDISVYDMKGKQVGSMTINESDLGGVVNPALVKQAFVMYHANLRQGSARTKNRHAIVGSTRKIARQKGSGRARHGDRKVAQFRGGGRAFAKTRTRDDYHQTMPRKMRRNANRNALLAKLVDNEVRVIDDINFKTPKTKSFADFIGSLKIDRSALVALAPDNANARLSARNIDDVTICHAQQLTCYEMLNHRYLVIARKDLEAWLSGPSSQTGKSARTDPMGRVEPAPAREPRARRASQKRRAGKESN